MNAVPKPFALDETAFAHLARELGWLAPFYLQLIADRIAPTGPLDGDKARAEIPDIDRAFDELLQPEYRKIILAVRRARRQELPTSRGASPSLDPLRLLRDRGRPNRSDIACTDPESGRSRHVPSAQGFADGVGDGGISHGA